MIFTVEIFSEDFYGICMDVMAEGCPPHIYAHPRGISDCRTKAPEGADELQFNTRVLPSF